MLKKTLFALVFLLGLGGIAQATEHYIIDTKGMLAFITFRIQHLGFRLFSRIRG